MRIVWDSGNAMLVLHFAFWAPDPDSVLVVGEFNNWDWNLNELIRDEVGCWFAEVRK